MPQQFIYTSTLRGLKLGSSGYCVVARSEGMGEMLSSRLEQISYYRHLHLADGVDRPVFCYRRLDVRGQMYYVISRLADSGYDFTKRTNFIAHHLVFKAEEILGYPTPPIICRDWSGWCEKWDQEAQSFSEEEEESGWCDLRARSGNEDAGAETWRNITGNPVNAFALLDIPPRGAFYVKLDERFSGSGDASLLTMFAESLQLLEVRDSTGFRPEARGRPPPAARAGAGRPWPPRRWCG